MSPKKGIAMAVVVLIVLMAAIGTTLWLANPATGTLSVYVTDAPAEWKHINVTFSEVKVHLADNDNESGWISIEIQNGQVDLAALTNVSELLASSDLQPGKYTQIRIVVISAVGQMTDGTNVTFIVPSGELKTNHPFNITAGNTQNLTLDFDLEKSIIHNSQGWIFKPVLGGISEE